MNYLKKKIGCCLLVVLLLLNYLPAIIVSASDDNTIQNAILIGENGSYTGTVSTDGVAYYQINLQTTGKVVFELSVFQKSSASIVLYNNELEDITSISIYYDGNRNCAYRKVSLFLNAGTYYIKLTNMYESVMYSFTTTFEDAQESFPESQYNPNDILSQAQTISIDQYYRGQIGFDDEQDFYIFTVPFSGNVTFKHYNYTENQSGYYAILNNEGNQTHSFTGYYDSNKGYAYDVDTCWLEKGTYYLKAYGNNGFYKFSINVKPEKGSVDYATRSKTKATLKIKKSDGVSGYVIQYSTSDKFSKKSTKTKTITSTNMKLSGLNSKKVYYIRVKCYKKLNGKTYYGIYGDTYTLWP